MFDVEVTDNLKDLVTSIRKWRVQIQRDLLKDVAELTVQQARERVKETKVSPDLKPWPPRKHVYKHPMLVKTGKLLRSIRKFRQGANEYRSGTDVKYAKYQQDGTDKIDPRPFIGVGFNDAKEIEDLIEAWVELKLQ